MSFNIIHYISLGVIAVIFIGGIITALKQSDKKLALPMILSVTLISVLLTAISIAVVEKYTKKVKLVKVQNKRYLTQEKISYYGFVKNVGKYPVAKVYLSIKLVNAGHATGNVKAGSFYKSSGFFDFFSKGAGKLYKPQKIEKEFVVARNLKPGEVVPFRVTFDYPPYFRNTSDFIKVYAH
jgi:hypothetical protein